MFGPGGGDDVQFKSGFNADECYLCNIYVLVIEHKFLEEEEEEPPP